MDGTLFERTWSSPLLRLSFRELKRRSAVNVVVVVDGEVDCMTASTLADCVQEASRHATTDPLGEVILDLAGVTFMGATGVRALLTVRKATHTLRIVAPSPPVLRVMALAAPGQFHTYPSIDAAVLSLPTQA